jgi:deoxycytidine triphosphate deaminase
VGHELAHYLIAKTSGPAAIDISSLLEAQVVLDLIRTSSDLPDVFIEGPPKDDYAIWRFRRLARQWLEELYCDAFAVTRFGAAGAAALAEHLDYAGATDIATESHPPGRLRVQMMYQYLKNAQPQDANGEWGLHEVDEAIFQPFMMDADSERPEWVEYLWELFSGKASSISEAVQLWSQREPYPRRGRQDLVRTLMTDIISGMPPRDVVKSDPEPVRTEDADVLNAAWLVATTQDEIRVPVDRLSLKALDTIDFLDRWHSIGGELLRLPISEDVSTGSGIVTEPELIRRIDSADTEHRLSVTPLLTNSIDASALDIRLGNSFITFVRSSASTFDSLEKSQDPRSMQLRVDRAWGDVFHLHPGELVLASTLEYIVMPEDLTARVVTRSSYGRLGLLCATAIQVHPGFAGCLTLELVNLGQMPLTITPGERVAQLVFSTVTDKASHYHESKYQYPTEPEFSKIQEDPETRILKLFREQGR